MPTDLEVHIRRVRIADTHEHLVKEREWLDKGPRDVLADLFSNYVMGDLIGAGADPKAVARLGDGPVAELESRWAAVSDAWAAVQFTGYGEAVRILAREVYDIDPITADACREAQPTLESLRRPGERLRLLRDVARLDHVQTDDWCWACASDASGPDFFFYDLSVWRLACGQIEAETLAKHTGITVTDLKSLDQALAALFARYAPSAIAVKSQHAYGRTLEWQPRADADAGRALQAILRRGDQADQADRLCLGDWALGQAIQLAIQHNLPIKFHCGYLAGNNIMNLDSIRPGLLCGVLKQYPQARFVLMHCGYPFGDELLALAKHFTNVWVDLCWAWSIAPADIAGFVRRFLHTVPSNKLLAFGGDTAWPTGALAYSIQARRWLTRALAAEVADGHLSEAQAVGLATQILRQNQFNCFDLETKRAALATR